MAPCDLKLRLWGLEIYCSQSLIAGCVRACISSQRRGKWWTIMLKEKHKMSQQWWELVIWNTPEQWLNIQIMNTVLETQWGGGGADVNRSVSVLQCEFAALKSLSRVLVDCQHRDQRGPWFGIQPELVQEDHRVHGFLQLIIQVCYLIEMKDTTWVVKVAMMSLPYI